MRWPCLLVTLFPLPLFAQDVPPPKPADVKSLAVTPDKVTLPGDDASAQLIVTATLNDGRVVDLTHDVKYTVDGPASVSETGRVLPKANGSADIAVSFGEKAVKVPVTVAHLGESRPINFPNQVVPVFTKLGCNSGGCHGKQAGQNGFRLSLLGFDPELDYATLVKESRGRRLLPASPDDSLFLLKATGTSPHGGGKKMEPGSDEYKVVRRWIAAGLPYGDEKDPTVSKITVFPDARVMTRQAKQQVAVYAHYTDGTVEDITRRAQFESNDQEVATADGDGVVRTLNMSGQAAVMARYQGKVAVFRATVPLGVKTPDWK
ncbi:MAG: Ig-like domain-containing protein, partial [Gemmataceae bacterium]|nr:Ig-like domain-containing protein [Gemmataceae bacterium]